MPRQSRTSPSRKQQKTTSLKAAEETSSIDIPVFSRIYEKRFIPANS
jgi:hypothetical protein